MEQKTYKNCYMNSYTVVQYHIHVILYYHILLLYYTIDVQVCLKASFADAFYIFQMGGGGTWDPRARKYPLPPSPPWVFRNLPESENRSPSVMVCDLFSATASMESVQLW